MNLLLRRTLARSVILIIKGQSLLFFSKILLFVYRKYSAPTEPQFTKSSSLSTNT